MSSRFLHFLAATTGLFLAQRTAPAQGLAQLSATSATLAPAFSPDVFDYTATLPASAGGLALFSAPVDPALRLFLRPANSVFQEVSLGPVIAAGRSHNLVLRADGSVVAWGDASDGKTSVPPAASSDIVAIAAGDDHSLALRSDGSVVAWGSNPAGQCTVPPAALSGVVALAAGGTTSYALKADGSIIGWGSGATTLLPTENFTAIAAGSAHGIALKADGSVKVWGSIGTLPSAAESGVVAIAAGGDRCLALKSDGSVLVWGNGSAAVLSSPPEAQGALALAADRDHNLAIRPDGSVFIWGETEADPLLLPPATVTADVAAVTVRESRALALKRDGTLVAWGLQPGDLQTVPTRALSGLRLPLSAARTVRYGSNTTEIRVAATPSLSSTAIPAASLRGRTLSTMDGNHLAVRPDGSVVSWGKRVPGTLTLPSPAPTGIVSVSAGGQHALALKADGTVSGWGLNSYGQTTPPAEATGLIAISAGYNHSLGLRSDGRVVAWGQNVATTFAVPATALTDVVAISASLNHNLALKADGSVLAWGYSPLATTPASVASGVVAIAAGYNYSLALKNDGSVVAWNGGSSSSPSVLLLSIPPDATDVVAIAAGYGNALALRSDGRVVAWGMSDYGVLDIPLEAQSGVVAIAVSYYQALALRSDGTVVSWGSSAGAIPAALAQTGILAPSSGPLAIVRPVDLLAPRVPLAATTGACFALRTDGSIAAWGTGTTGTLLPPAGSFVALEGGSDHVLALRADGSVVAWGSNLSGTGKATPPATAASDLIAVSAGSSFSLALKRDGSVLVWGTTSSTLLTVPVLSPTNAEPTGYRYTAIAASDATAFALRSDGRVVAWGSSTLTTVPATAQSGVVAIAAGSYHALALKTDGTIVGWGDNSYSQANAQTPRSPAVAITAGSLYSAALLADGSVMVWGYTGNSVTSVPVAAQSGVVSLVGGPSHLVALKADGTLVRWGSTSGTPPSPLPILRPGPVGTAYRATFQRPFPSPALTSLTTSAGPLTPAFTSATTNYTQTVAATVGGLTLDSPPASAAASIQLSVNGAPTLTLLPGPTLFLHPANNDILGLTAQGGVTSDSTLLSTPANMPAAARADLVSLCFAANRAVGLNREGGLVAWSLNNPGALAIPPDLASGVIQIVSDNDEIVALKADGSVRAWSPENLSLNYLPPDVRTGVARLSAGCGGTRVALKTDGSVRAWGGINAPPPEASSGVVAIHACDGLAFAQKADGTLILWGACAPAVAAIPAAVQTGKIAAVVANYYSAQALLADGSVVSWGTALPNPTPVEARNGVVALAANDGSKRAAQKADGSVVRWDVSSTAAAETFALSLAPPRSVPIALRYGANQLSLRVTPLGRTVSAASMATGYYRHIAVTQQGTLVYRSSSSFSSGVLTIPTEAQSGVASVYSGNYGEFALTTAGRLVSLSGPSIPSDAQPTTPGQIPIRAPIASLAVGSSSALLLRTDGTTRMLGSFSSGTIPANAQSGVIAVAIGSAHALALRADGRVVAWGTSLIATSIPAGAQTDVIAIAAASDRSLALKADGSVIAWGSGFSTPLPAEVQSGVIGIAVNEVQALALKADGSVFAWGQETASYPPPAAVSSGVIALFASGSHQVALKADGTTVTWGHHSGGGTVYPADFGAPLLAAPVRDYHLTITRLPPSPALTFLGASVGSLSPAFASDTFSYTLPATPYSALALPGVALFPGDELSVRVGTAAFAPRFPGPTLAATNLALLALRLDGSVQAFGGGGVSTLPTATQSGIAALAAGEDHAFALKRDGSLIGWGSNNYGQLTSLPGGADFVALASGLHHGLAVRRDGSVAAWGRSFELQLLVPSTATDVVAVAAGETTSMALLRNGGVVAWGRSSPNPQTIPPDAQSGVIAIAAGRAHYLALRADGRVVQWGGVSGMTEAPSYRFVAIAAMGDQNLGLRPDGEIVNWGGYSDPIPQATSATSTGISSLAFGPRFAAAQRTDGSLLVIPALNPGPNSLNNTSAFAGPFAQPLGARVPLALGANTVEVRVTRPDSALPSATYALELTRLTAPGLRMGAGTPAELASTDPYIHNFGLRRTGATSPAQLFTLLNTGTADLVISAASLFGSSSADFSVTGLTLPLTLAPGASITFNATTTPSVSGIRVATLLFTVNLPNAEPAGFILRTEGVSYVGDRNSWRASQFSSADLADPALETTLWGDLADPDADGIPNLLEYAIGTGAQSANPSPTPLTIDAAMPGGPRLALTYQRRIRAAIGGLVFRVEWSDDLTAASWSADDVTETVTSANSLSETVVASVPVGAGSARFLRLRVTAP